MKKILIVNASYYKDITAELVKSSSIILKRNKYKISILTVPGVFEIPVAIKRNIKKFHAFIASPKHWTNFESKNLNPNF